MNYPAPRAQGNSFSKDTIDVVYARSALHLFDEEIDEFLTTTKILLKTGGYLMVQGKPNENYKIQMSREVNPNLCVNGDGRIRRLWNEENINKLVNKIGFKLVRLERTTEKWRNKDSHFISFIAQKI